MSRIQILIRTVVMFILSSYGAATGEQSQIRRGVGKPEGISSLPEQVMAPANKLTLFADFKDIRGESIVLYLVLQRHFPNQLHPAVVSFS
jgi:hypothetical protein